MNRLPPNENPDDKQKRIQDEIARRLNAIMDHAAMLYDLLEPGMTVEIKLEDAPSIVVPGQTPKQKKLYITKPGMVLEVQG